MSRQWMHGLLLVMLLAGGRAACVEPADRVVLIVATDSRVLALDAIDIKRLFLGIPVAAGGTNLHALRNDSDERLHMIFLQHIVAMSDAVYERQLLALTLEQGRRAPPVYRDAPRLIAALATDPTAVSYAWASTITHDPRVRVLREIWRD